MQMKLKDASTNSAESFPFNTLKTEECEMGVSFDNVSSTSMSQPNTSFPDIVVYHHNEHQNNHQGNVFYSYKGEKLKQTSVVCDSQTGGMVSAPVFVESSTQVQPSNTNSTTSSVSVSRSQSNEPQVHKNTSDIETIITALEEELKKTGKEESKQSLEVIKIIC